MVSMCPPLQKQRLKGWWVNWQIGISQVGEGSPLLLELILDHSC